MADTALTYGWHRTYLPQGSAADMDLEEFHDFCVETDLPTKEYAFEAMKIHYQEVRNTHRPPTTRR